MDGKIALDKQDRFDLITFQNQLVYLTSLRFMYTSAFYWWTHDFAKFSPALLFEQWVNCFEQSYGDLLAHNAVQQMLGEQVNLAIKGWQVGIPRL